MKRQSRHPKTHKDFSPGFVWQLFWPRSLPNCTPVSARSKPWPPHGLRAAALPLSAPSAVRSSEAARSRPVDKGTAAKAAELCCSENTDRSRGGGTTTNTWTWKHKWCVFGNYQNTTKKTGVKRKCPFKFIIPNAETGKWRRATKKSGKLCVVLHPSSSTTKTTPASSISLSLL